MELIFVNIIAPIIVGGIVAYFAYWLRNRNDK
ncbi:MULTISPECIES: type I toxin-antitoxin system Fst family toxin [Nosocomiicoccus]|uniref:Type I toxin-antitoxin system Fst family toxin n=1 Tax=Nosocomiicoccus massiliensis TaxID=1232430 RepID=A0AAF1BNL4_9STAP|nr:MULTISPECIES: type I toxin-antitoxin system Fst family toxin [Nosocomiicoccus]MDK6862989.1 type I toxin-antitoxin system Fst family toxin [Nosocomiicoccus ampullae]MDK6864179.1 type I toxin-antitoxin system Fst family toxin [Nosocomiicoccus ampullae]WOS96350.1 type I toxin-antitoxin system Fst family toxin [Nosocomiicoccus massiliensis]